MLMQENRSRAHPEDRPICGASPDLLLASPAGTTTWRCTTAGTRAPPCWGSSAGRSRRLPSSPAASSCSSSSCPTTRLTGRGSPFATRSSKQVGGALTNRKSAMTWTEYRVFPGSCSRLSSQSELDLRYNDPRVKQTKTSLTGQTYINTGGRGKEPRSRVLHLSSFRLWSPLEKMPNTKREGLTRPLHFPPTGAGDKSDRTGRFLFVCLLSGEQQPFTHTITTSGSDRPQVTERCDGNWH